MNSSLVVVLCLSTILLLQACSDRTPESDMAEARKSLEQEDFNRAEIYLKRALSNDLENQDARRLLGLTRYQLGDWTQAVIEWGKLVDPQEAKAIGHQRMMALYFMGQTDELAKLSSDEVEDAYLSRKEALITASAYRDKEISAQAAINTLQETLESNEEDPVIWSLLGYIQATEGQLDNALQNVNRALGLDPDYYLSLGLLGDVYRLKGDQEKSLEAYSKVVTMYPWRMEELYKRMSIHIGNDNYEEAKKDLAVLKKVMPNSVPVNYAEGLINYKNSQFSDAISNFQQSMGRVDAYPDSLLYLANSNLMMGNLNQSEDYARRYSLINPESEVSQLMMVNIKLAAGKFEEVIKLIEPMSDEIKKNPDILRAYAVALLSVGKQVQAEELMSEAFSNNVDSEALYVLSATEKMSADKLDDAFDVARKGLEKYPDSLKLEKISLIYHLKSGDQEKALSMAQAIVTRTNDSIQSLLMLADVYQSSGEDEKAIGVWNEIIEREPGNKLANFKLADSARKNDDLQGATKYYQNILDKDPRDKQASISKFAVLAALGKDKNAIAAIEKSIEYHPFDLGLKNTLAKYYILKGRSEKVASLYNTNLDDVYKNPESYGLLIRSKIEVKNYKEALFELEKYAKLLPGSPDPYYMAATVYGRMGKGDGVEKSLIKALDVDPDYFPAQISYAKYMLEFKEVNEFSGYIADLYEKYPKNAEVKYLFASTLDKQGRPTESLHLVKSAYEDAASSTHLRFWSYICVKLKDVSCLKETEGYYSFDTDENVSTSLVLAGLYLSMDEKQNAIRVYEKILKSRPKNVNSLNNLAWIYQDIDKEKSLNYSRKANTIDPDSPLVLDTMAYSLLINGYHQEAVEAITKANALRPGDPTLLYHSADIKSQAGKKSEARKILDEVLSSGKMFPEKDKANRLLSKLELEE